MRICVGLFTVVAASLLGLMPAMATTISPFVGTPPSNDPRNDSIAQAGFGFAANPSGTAQVNELGFYDEGGDGLAAAHTVGLYHYNGSAYELLASTTIPAGTGATLENGYRWGSIPTITLTDTDQSNGWYALMASQDTDTWYNVTTGSGLPIVTNYGNTGFGLLAYYTASAFPSVGGTVAFSFGGGIQYGSPNMGFLVPEPSSALLMIFGVALLGWRFRNRSA